MSFARTPHSPPRTPTRAVSVRRRACNKSSRAGVVADEALFQVTCELRAQPAAAHDTLRTSSCHLGMRRTPFASFRMEMVASLWGFTTRDGEMERTGGSQDDVEHHPELGSGATRLGEHR